MTGRTVIFLDIDGVLQPHGQQDRFQHDMDKLREELAHQYDNDDYLEMDKYDLAAVCYDWHKEAVERLRRLCIEYNAEIVISSDWRLHNPVPTLQAYFRIHNLHQYVVDETVQNSQSPLYRAGEVKQYLEEHPEIERFVIIDDNYGREFKSIYPHNFVYTRSYLDEELYQRARQILDGTVPRYELKQALESSHYGQLVAEIDTGRLLAGVGHTAHRAYVFPLNTPKGLGVLQEHAFDHPFHNGVFVGQNEVICGERRANFWSHHGDWRQPDNPAFEERGIIRYEEAPHIEPLLIPIQESSASDTAEPNDDETPLRLCGFRFVYETTWNDASDQPMLDEVRTIDIYEGEDGIFCDLLSQKKASYGSLEFLPNKHGSLGIRVQPQLLPVLGGEVLSEPSSYSRGPQRGTADWVANGRHRDYVAYEANVKHLGTFGVCLSVLENNVSRTNAPGQRAAQNRGWSSGWGNQRPDHLRGPWFIRDYGMAMFNATLRYAVNVEEGESWTAGLRVVAYDEKLTHDRAIGFRDVEQIPRSTQA